MTDPADPQLTKTTTDPAGVLSMLIIVYNDVIYTIVTA